MQISPFIDYLQTTQKIYLFVPENEDYTFFDDVHETFGFSETQYTGLSQKELLIRVQNL